jgi:hypothetical protein
VDGTCKTLCLKTDFGIINFQPLIPAITVVMLVISHGLYYTEEYQIMISLCSLL